MEGHLRDLILALTITLVWPAGAQKEPTVVSPEIAKDRSVTFRIWAPKASDVQLSGNWMGPRPPVPLTKNDEGVWTTRVAPLEPKLPWDEVKEFTRLVAEFLVRAEPGLFIANMSKAKRTGKVFADYLRNSETASAVSAYSARAREEAGVSTPLDWDELGKADIRNKFTVLSVPKRLASLTLDPWAEYSSTRQSITDAMWNALRAKT